LDLEKKDHMIIGTAGHIDHGKTALVKALTGIDADTLAEEKRRGITIELGFVFLDAPEAKRQIVFIDVPGHEKLVKTMVAGASNIDAALLVVAADEGLSLQTREHFEILQLLDIKKGIVALTKSDLVDSARLHQVTTEVKDFIRGTFLENAPIFPASSITGEGINDLRSAVVRLSDEVGKRLDSGVFRMPVDRVFTMPGFGTVIAGTILSGEIRVGDRVEILPERLSSRVRGIHVHHQKVESSSLGVRTAVNLADIKKEDLYRGQCAASPQALFPTMRMDARLFLLKSSGKELKNRARVRLHIGTAEVICRLVLLDMDKLKPGDSGFVQFILESLTTALPGDRFVIRSFSPLITIGGGVVLDAYPSRHKRLDENTISSLDKLEGDIISVVEQMYINSGFTPQSAGEVALKIGKKESAVNEAADKLFKEGRLLQITPKERGVDKSMQHIHILARNRLSRIVIDKIEDFLAKNPDKLKMPSAELRSRLEKITDFETFNAVLERLLSERQLLMDESEIRLVGYGIELSSKEQKWAENVEYEFRKAGYRSPPEEEVRVKFGIREDAFKKIMSFLIEQEKLVRLSDKVTYHNDIIGKLKTIVLKYINQNGSIKISDLRDELAFSRKYAQAILEYFDSSGVTKRVGDAHIIK
jgi:selenocysteine-specific elongation factor